MTDIPFQAIHGQRNLDVASAFLGEPFSLGEPCNGQLHEVVAQHRIRNSKRIAQLGEVCPLQRGQAGTDPQANWGRGSARRTLQS